MEFNPHFYQQLVLDAPERFIAAIAGKQSGKTMVGPVWLCKEIYSNFSKNLRGDYLITAPTNKILEQAALPKFKDIMPSDWGEWKEQKHCFELVWGDKIYVRSADEPKHIESMTLRAGWGDEAGQFKVDVWRNLMARVAILQGRLLLTTTPYTANWLKRDILKRAHRVNAAEFPGDREIVVINWTSQDNPYFAKEEFERLRDSLPPAIFARDYEGKFTSMSGLVYPDFDEDTHVVKPFDIPADWRRIGGLDFGHEDPAACLSVVEDKDVSPSIFYVSKEFYKTHAGLKDIAAFITDQGLSRVEADPQSKQLIFELVNQFGLGQVTKANNDIDSGILRITELLKTKAGDGGPRLRFFDCCVNLIDEMNAYRFPAPDDEKARKDKPVDKDNHALDALRYTFAKGFTPVYTEAANRILPKKQFVRNLIEIARRDTDPFTGYY